MLYLLAFDLKSDRLPALGTLTLATSGQTDIVVDLTAVSGPTTAAAPDNVSNVFFHWASIEAGPIHIRATDRSGELRREDISYYGFEQSLTLYVNAQGWPGTFTIYLDLATGLVTAAYSGGNFSMTWSTAAGRALCGFSANQSGDDQYTGTVVPMFVVKPTSIGAVSMPSRKTRERGGLSAVRADGGGGSSLGRYVSAQRIKFVQQYEDPARVESELARPGPTDWSSSTHPTALEDVFDQAASGLPFILHDGELGYDDDMCLALTSDAAFEPEGSGSDKMNVAALHTSFDCWVEGKVSTS